LAGARPEFALSAPPALERVKAIAEPSLILILSDRCDLAIKGASGTDVLGCGFPSFTGTGHRLLPRAFIGLFLC